MRSEVVHEHNDDNDCARGEETKGRVLRRTWHDRIVADIDKLFGVNDNIRDAKES